MTSGDDGYLLAYEPSVKVNKTPILFMYFNGKIFTFHF